MILHSVDYGEYCKVLEDVIFIKKNLIYIFIFGSVGFSLLHRLFSNFDKQGLLSSCGAGASIVGTFGL